MIIHRFPLFNPIHPPQENPHAIHQSQHGDERESHGGGEGDVVAEI